MQTRHQLLLGILLFFLSIQSYLFLHYHYVFWDSGVYMGMAKYLYSHGEIGLWESIRPPFLPLLLGIFWKIGLPILLTGKALTFLFSLGSLYFVYRLGKQLTNWYVGLIATFIMVTSTSFLFLGTQVMSDIPSLFFALLGLFFLLEDRTFLAGLFLSMSFLTRFPQGFILIAVCLYLFFAWIQHRESFSHFLKKKGQ